MGHNTYFLTAYLSWLMTSFSLHYGTMTGVRVREESDTATRCLLLRDVSATSFAPWCSGQGWGHTAHLFSPNTHIQMCLPSQAYAHKHACTHALMDAHACAHRGRKYYTLVLNGKSCHLQFQIKACLSAYGRHHQQQLGVLSKTGH